MQTILGAGGAIGTELAKELKKYTSNIRLVGRNPQKINETDQLFAGDLTKYDDVLKALKGTKIAYLTVGLPYDKKIWQKYWPVIMQNVIKACTFHQCKLVFFDNIYMYNPDHLGHMDENTPLKPVSKKGQIRMDIANMLWEEIKKGTITAIIARSADFYGPGIKNNSILTETVFNNLKQGKKATWLGSSKYKHSYTYTPDAGKATAILGNTDDAYNQVWHLPTASNPPTGREWIQNIAHELGVNPRFRNAPRFMIRILGLFLPIMKEMVEMMYQYENDYIFLSEKFNTRFGFEPVSYKQGVKEIVEKDYSQQ